MDRFTKIALLGLAHGLSDCAAGFMIGILPDWSAGEVLEPSLMVLLYNVLAFGGQVPAGLLVDRLGNPKLFVAGSLCLVAIALGIFPLAPGLAIVLAGVAGAFFHVSGGMLALLAFPGSTVGAGLFAAPGVMGITLGGYMAWAGASALLPLTCVAVGMMGLVLLLKMPFVAAPKSAQDNEPFEWHDLLMMVLLLAIAMRSAIWNLMEAVNADDHRLLLEMGVAAMAGKVWGGLAAHRWGWRRYGVLALMAAAPLLALASSRWLLLPGIFLLQSATPSAVLGMYKLMPRLPATAVGMTFGLAIALGGIPAVLDWEPGLWVALLLVPLAGAGYWWGMRRAQ